MPSFSTRLAQRLGRQDDSSAFAGKTAVICGGSKGIGRATAAEIVRQGGSVALVARDPDTLQAAAGELAAARTSEGQFVETVACDSTDMEALRPQLEAFVAAHGAPDYLINAVGYAYPQYVHELGLEDFERQMHVNYFGQVVPILILLPHFMAARRGHIANISSMMGYMGIIGYAAYAPSKYAIVGLTEVLRHELKPYNIRFSILFPPDTDTPGFALENRSKPPETATLSASAKLLSAETVGAAFARGLRRGDYEILPGEAGLIWRAFRHLPALVRFVIDRDLNKARAKLGKT